MNKYTNGYYTVYIYVINKLIHKIQLKYDQNTPKYDQKYTKIMYKYTLKLVLNLVHFIPYLGIIYHKSIYAYYTNTISNGKSRYFINP